MDFDDNGGILLFLRRVSGKKQVEIARYLGVTKGYVSRMERSNGIRVSVIKDLSEWAGVPYVVLVWLYYGLERGAAGAGVDGLLGGIYGVEIRRSGSEIRVVRKEVDNG